MKRYIYILLLLPIGLLWMCEAEERGQIPMDTIPPGQVTSVSVENLPGGAIVSYIIPEDEDLLYVKAIYRLDDGRIMEQKASAYSTALEIVGIGKGNPQTIQLITGDRSKNESAPLDVEIYPLDSPIYDILKSINIMNDFGGITLQWENPLEADIIISIDTLDMDNNTIRQKQFIQALLSAKGALEAYLLLKEFLLCQLPIPGIIQQTQ